MTLGFSCITDIIILMLILYIHVCCGGDAKENRVNISRHSPQYIQIFSMSRLNLIICDLDNIEGNYDLALR